MTSSSKRCSPSWNDRYTYYMQMFPDHRPTTSPSSKHQTHALPHSRQSLSYLLLAFRPTLIIPYLASMCEPHAIGITPPSSSPFSLVAWRSRNASLYRWTRREIATWEVTEIICRRRSLQMFFFAVAPHPFLRPHSSSPADGWVRFLPVRNAQSFPPQWWQVYGFPRRRTHV